ncbi:MAG: glycosyltransferase [Mariprofundales bacterium]
MHKIAFVVPTKDREPDLRIMLASLSAQTRRPDQVIVVDGSDPDIAPVVADFPELSIDYVREFPPSLSRQRNAGMARLRDEITLAGYLDDDLELEPAAVEKMLRFWNSAAGEYGGASFAITNAPRTPCVGLMALFGLDHPEPGRVLATGWISPFGCPDHDIDVDWLCGGATVWRREVVDSFGYDEWFQGTGFMEDVDFSYRVRERFRLAVVAAARVAHYHHPIRQDRYQLLGKWQIINRLYLVRKHRHRGLSMISAWGASIGLVAVNVVLSMRHRDLNGLRCAWGNLLGMVMELRGEKALSGHLK